MGNATIVNFASGETSPKSRGRFDIASYNSSCRKLENFIAEVSGAARYRNGFKHIAETRAGATARIIPFQLNDSQAYMLEFTSGKMRVYKNEQLLMSSAVAAKPILAVIDYGAPGAGAAFLKVTAETGIGIGDHVYVSGVVGMTELNGRVFRVRALGSGATLGFSINDAISGANIDPQSYGAYVSGGTVELVYEVTP
jgi:hypothetical protein